MNSATEKQLLMELHHHCIEQATTITTLRARLNQLEIVHNETQLAAAEQEPAAAALEEFTNILMERVRLEREAYSEPGMWARTPLGNSVALTLYQDLAGQLARIRKSYGL